MQSLASELFFWSLSESPTHYFALVPLQYTIDLVFLLIDPNLNFVGWPVDPRPPICGSPALTLSKSQLDIHF